MSKEEREAKDDMEKASMKGWLEKERCTLSFKVECWCKLDCCWDEVNLATLTFWEYYHILNSGVSLCIEE